MKNNKQQKEVEVTEVEITEEPTLGNFTRPLFTIFKNHDTNMWCVGQVNFDPARQLVNPKIEIVAEEVNKELCIERFKIKVARELLNG